MNQRHIDESVGAYVLGALEADEIAELDAHLDSCARCRDLVAAARPDVDLLPLTVPTLAPPAGLRAKVIARVKAEAAAASLTTSAPLTTLSRHEGGLRRWFRGLLGEESALGDPAVAKLAALMSRADSVIWTVAGTDAAPSASAKLVGIPGEREAVLVTNGLAPLNEDQVYQIWLLRDGKPQPSSLFRIMRGGMGCQIVRSSRRLGDYGVVAVTPEPAAGSPAPTGSIVLMGALSA